MEQDDLVNVLVNIGRGTNFSCVLCIFIFVSVFVVHFVFGYARYVFLFFF